MKNTTRPDCSIGCPSLISCPALITWSALATALLLLLASGCTGHGFRETDLPTRIDYRCANSRVMKVERAQDGSAAAVLIDNSPVILPRSSSPAQEKYTDGNYVLYLQGERAMLEKNSHVLFGPCSAGPLPKAVREGFDNR